jgi:hypothetical protein
MASSHGIVVALVGEAPLQTESSTSRRLWSDFFLIETQTRRLSGSTALQFAPICLEWP